MIMHNLQSSKGEDPSNSLPDKVSHQRQLCNTTDPQGQRNNNLNDQDKYDQQEIQNEATINEQKNKIANQMFAAVDYKKQEQQDQGTKKL